MKTLRLRYLCIFITLMVLFLSACQRRPLPSEMEPTQTPEISINESVIDEEVGSEPTEIINESEVDVISDEDEDPKEVEEVVESQPNTTPTPDLRMKPEQWQEWPVIPEISPNTISIYKKGLELGNDPHRFSKIGDCQSIKEVLLGIYDLPNRYTLTEENRYLQETIDYYSGSFDRNGMAVRGGFNAATVLSPIWADPEFCEPGENPIQCEYRVHQPTMVIISLEVWWDGRSPERYEQYLRRIIEYSIEQGVVPILSTKADNVEGDHSINLTTAKLAYEYDIPMWNFWLAVQDLPYQGIDPARDGFHISVDAWNRRSFTALQTIHAVHQAVTNAEGNEINEEIAATEEPADEQPVISSLVFGSTNIPPYDMDGTIFFEMTETIDGDVLPAGIYSLKLNDGDLFRLFPAGAEIISENLAHGFIVNDGNGLSYISNTGDILSLSGFNAENRRVIMINPYEFIAIAEDPGKDIGVTYGIIEQTGVVSEAAFDIPLIDGQITEVLMASKDIMIVSVGDCTAEECVYYSVENYLIPEQTHLIEMYPFENPAIQIESGMMAFWREINGTESLYTIDLKNHGNEQYLGLFGNVFLDQAWKNADNTLAAIKMERSDYYGRATEILHYVVDGNTNIIKEYSAMSGLNPLISWSPDGQFLLTSITQVDNPGNSTIVLRILNTVSGQEAYLDSDLGLSSETYIAITKLIWLD